MGALLPTQGERDLSHFVRIYHHPPNPSFSPLSSDFRLGFFMLPFQVFKGFSNPSRILQFNMENL
jgi:hypothetical protein